MAGNALVHGGDAPNRTQKLRFNRPLESINTETSLGSNTMLSFGAVGGVKRSGNLVFSSSDEEEFGDKFLDEYLNQQDKKRRLTVDQVQFLERCFNTGNKLEPERKIQLANELGLQPRQIAVWFQNRRARWKTKHMETDYETLRARYETLKADYDNLLKENDNLKAEVLCLKRDNIGGDTKNANSQLHDPKGLPGEANARTFCEDEESEVSALAFKNEEQSSAKSEVTNTDSPRMTDGIHSHILESGVICHVFYPHYSDSSQNGGDNLQKELVQPDCLFPKIEDVHRNTPPCYYGSPVEDHAFNFWPY